MKPGYFQAVQNLLDVSLPNSGLKAEPHIKSRLKTLKANFSTFHDLISVSGFGWDPDKCTITASSDVWEEYVKSHKNASIFKDKTFPYYHKLCTIFGKSRATGSRSIDLGEEEVVAETQENAPIDLEDQEDTSMHVPPSQEDTSVKRKRSKRNDDLIQVYKESCNTFNNTIIAIGNEMNMNLSKIANDEERRVDLMRRVQNEIHGLPGITFEEAFEATKVIEKCPLNAEMFFGYDQERKIWMVKMSGKKSTS